MKKAVIAVVVLGLIGAGGYGVYHYYLKDTAKETERVSSSSEDAVYVDSVSVITGYGSGNGLIERYGGEVEPQETLEVKLESERTVKKCFVKEGDEVKEGQRLFIYDTQEDEDKLEQAEIDIEKSKGDIEVAEQQIASYEKAKQSAGSDEQLEYTTNIMSLQTGIKQSEYEIKTKELEIKKLKERIADATVTSELSGVVKKINDPSAGSSSYGYGSDNDSAAYITILSLGDYRIKGSVNEQNLQDLQTLYDMGSQMIVYSRVDSSQMWYGTISEIKTDQAEEDQDNMYMYSYGGGADSSSYAFYVELENSDGLILGQHVYMEEDAGQNDKKDGLWLEDYYLMQEGDQAYVWMANQDNVLEKHEVTLGAFDEDLMKYEITDGLAADDYIAVPQDGVEAGAPVIYNDAAADMTGGAIDYEGDPAEFDGDMYGGDDFTDPDSMMDYDEGAMDMGELDAEGALSFDEDMDGGVYDVDAEDMDGGAYDMDADDMEQEEFGDQN